MIAVVSLFAVLVLSLVITRLGATALRLTGLAPDAARFQARSAFSGAGFTTAESEAVVGHPVRRRIIGTLILFGNAGLVTAVVSLLLSFTDVDGAAAGGRRLGLLVLLLGGLWLLARSTVVDRAMTGAMARALRRFSRIDARDYAGLLHLHHDWTVAELRVDTSDHWLCDRTLGESQLPDEGVLVLGIERSDGVYVGAPRSTTKVERGDVIVVYGPDVTMAELQERRRDPAGEAARRRSEAAHRAALDDQDAAERSHGTV